jgi:eukaryotic-like serine/threonine-protein kinase
VSSESLVGETLDDRYKLVRVMGEGGMGCVYEATHAGTGRRVAVKVISTGDVGRDEQLVGRFHREAKAAGSIDTQHIAQVLDTGTHAVTGHPFMVMEHLTGEDLQQCLRRVGMVSAELALRIIAQVCIGLQKAHEARVVHRDIKPANLYLARRDAGEVIVKILDFGIAKIKMEVDGAETGGLTRTGSMLGSPLYMSPEQARGSKTIDHRADIWSLGVVLYQALAGRTPYQDIEALGELIIAICSTPPPLVQEFAPWVHPDVASIVHRALHYDREQRFQSAAEMLDAIKALLPNGWSLDESMLVAITDEEKAQVAPRLSQPRMPSTPQVSAYPPPMSTPPPSPLGAYPPPPGPPGTYPPPPRMPLPPAAALTADAAGTASGVAQSQPAPRAPSPISRAMFGGVVLGGVALLGLGGFGAVKLFGTEPAATPVVATAPVPAAPTTTPQSGPTVAPASTDRAVKLVVLPDDVTVEIDGVPAPTKRGVVEIIGPLGSMHKVKLTSGKEEIIEEVVVTANGAHPPKLELLPEKTKSKSGKASTTSTAATNGGQKKSSGGLEKNFE